jgi:hypothetical protein
MPEPHRARGKNALSLKKTVVEEWLLTEANVNRIEEYARVIIEQEFPAELAAARSSEALPALEPPTADAGRDARVPRGGIAEVILRHLKAGEGR